MGKTIFKGLSFVLFGRLSLKSLESDRIDIEIDWVASLNFVMSSVAREEGEISGHFKRPTRMFKDIFHTPKFHLEVVVIDCHFMQWIQG